MKKKRKKKRKKKESNFKSSHRHKIISRHLFIPTTSFYIQAVLPSSASKNSTIVTITKSSN